MFQEITCASGNLHLSHSVTLAENLSYGSTPGSLEGLDGRHSDWAPHWWMKSEEGPIKNNWMAQLGV